MFLGIGVGGWYGMLVGCLDGIGDGGLIGREKMRSVLLFLRGFEARHGMAWRGGWLCWKGT